jgi:outer membrane protein OmpA-like peptidoglycan-associated protein
MRWYFLLGLFLSVSAHALDLQYFKFTHNPTYSNTDNALLDKGLVRNDYPFIFNASYDYVKTPLSIQLNGSREKEIVKNMQSLSFGGAWHPTDALLIGIRSRFSRLGGVATDGASGTYLGDTFIDGIWKFYQSERNAIALHPRLTVPTGTQDNFTTQNRKVGGYLGMNLERRFDWFQGVINVGYSHEPGASLSIPAFSSTLLNYKESIFTAVGTFFPLAQSWALNLEAYRYNNFKGNQHPNEVYAGVRHEFNPDLAGFGGISTGGLVDSSANDYRFSAGVKYYPGGQKKPLEKIIQVTHAEPKPISKRDEILKKESDLHGKLLSMENVYFSNAVSSLDNLSQGILDKISKQVKGKENSMTIVLEGYASTKGNPEANLLLSKKRADNVRTHLKNQGVGDSNIKIVAYGDSRADSSVSEALNRKVMIRVYHK